MTLSLTPLPSDPTPPPRLRFVQIQIVKYVYKGVKASDFEGGRYEKDQCEKEGGCERDCDDQVAGIPAPSSPSDFRHGA